MDETQKILELELELERLRLGLGPTGRAPEGKLREDDRGELRAAITAGDGRVVLNFGTQGVPNGRQKLSAWCATSLVRTWSAARTGNGQPAGTRASSLCPALLPS